jgi:hypothetical protein
MLLFCKCKAICYYNLNGTVDERWQVIDGSPPPYELCTQEKPQSGKKKKKTKNEKQVELDSLKREVEMVSIC